MDDKLYQMKAKSFNLSRERPFYFFRYQHHYLEPVPLHSHNFIELVFVWSGSATHVVNYRRFGQFKYKIYPGDIFMINPNDTHTYQLDYGEQVEIVNMLIDPAMLDSIFMFESSMSEQELMDFFYAQPFLSEEARLSLILKLDAAAIGEIKGLIVKIEKEYEEKRKDYIHLLRLLLTELFIRISRCYAEKTDQDSLSTSVTETSEGTAEYLPRIIDFMKHHYNEDFSVEQLAEMASCSKRQFARSFRQATGVSVIQYLHRLRIERAKKLLSLSNKKVRVISKEVGFRDISFFNKVFKRDSGMSPKAFQAYHQQLRQNDNEYQEDSRMELKAPSHLKCEYLRNPLGIDADRPRLSWIWEQQTRGSRQSAYQIQVASSAGQLSQGKADLWDSGQVMSDQSVHIAYAGEKLTSGMQCWWMVRIWDQEGRITNFSAPAWWEMGLLAPEDWQARWIGMPAAQPYCATPLLRKEYVADRPIVRARAYVCGIGYYELFLNGQKVGDHLLDPGHTNYDKRSLYVTHDVTDYCRTGANAVAVSLAHGWYGRENDLINTEWGTAPRLIVQLHVEYEDGSVQKWITDESWQVSSGPLMQISSYVWNKSGGEVYDARLEQEGWSSPGFRADRADSWVTAEQFPSPTQALSAQMHEPTRVTRSLQAVTMTRLESGNVVYDFGRCFSGWVVLKVEGERGTEVSMRFGELIHDSGELDEDNVYGQENRYILKGEGVEIWRPSFTYHGFRYVSVAGLPGEPAVDQLIGEWVHDDVEDHGDFSSSDEMLNQIAEAVRWTQKSLMHSGVFEDCPHRERIGYGDGHMVTEQAMFNYGMGGFYSKWSRDWADAQEEASGSIYHAAPYHGFSGGGPGWGSAVALIPWDMYVYYGDKEILCRQYPAIQKWIGFLESQTENHLLQFYAVHPHQPEWEFLGDWVAPRRDMTTYDWQKAFDSSSSNPGDERPFEQASGNWPDLPSNILFNSMFLYLNVWIAHRIAVMVSDDTNAAKYSQMAEQIKQAINERFYDREHAVYGNGEQPYLAFALLLQIVPPGEEQRVLNALIYDIMEVRQGHLDTGHFGTRFLLNALMQYGREDIAHHIVSKRTFPSWGYMIDQGATTIWEQWHPHMSRIHACFLSVGAWFYKGLGGIRPAVQTPGFKHFEIRPYFADNLTFVNTSYKSAYGTIESKWRLEGTHVHWHIRVPANSTADVHVPVHSREQLTEQGRPVLQAAGVRWVREEQGKQVLHLESGMYEFEWPLNLTKV